MTSPLIITPNIRYGLEGRIVTMNEQLEVIPNGVIYIEGDTIIAVQKYSDPAPEGFLKKNVIKTSDTIYPGLIELHNHLSYNITPQWMVPEKYGNRNQWRRHPEYKHKITAPPKILGKIEPYAKALVRFVECKCLMSGTTTSQGISLVNNNGIKKYYKGIVRNVEQPLEEGLSKARTRIGDVSASKAGNFLKTLNKTNCLLLHLSEGVDESARRHFLALEIEEDEWAITPSLAGIHANGLKAEDLRIMKDKGGSIIWSPMSNLMLYGKTLDIVNAKQIGIPIGLGSDWSPSGSKNLLCELKVAKLLSESRGGVFSDEEIVKMVTSNPAKILKWDHLLGSIEAGKKADLLMIRTDHDDPYASLINAKETSIQLVVIDGIPRYGIPRIMKKFGGQHEEVKFDDKERLLNLAQDQASPIFLDLPLTVAMARLQEGMAKLPELAQQLAFSNDIFSMGFSSANGQTETSKWIIEMDHEDTEEASQRHHLPHGEVEDTGGSKAPKLDFNDALLEMADFGDTIQAAELDDLLIQSSRRFFEDLMYQKNVPEFLKLELPQLYGFELAIPSDTTENSLAKSLSPHLDFVKNITYLNSLGGRLSKEEKCLILQQAKLLIKETYVHLPLKQSMHAANPIEALEVLEYKINNEAEYALEDELAFHKEVISILNDLKDLHTNYILPFPYKDKVAFLPFFVEEYFEQQEMENEKENHASKINRVNGNGLPNGTRERMPKYIASKILDGTRLKHFQEGVEILYWNGVQIREAIIENGNRYAGCNPAALFARGIDSLTIRPLARMLPPKEEWVQITYRDNSKKRKIRTINFHWQLTSFYSSIHKWYQKTQADHEIAFGYDQFTNLVHQIKKVFYAPKLAMVFEPNGSLEKVMEAQKATDYLPTTLPNLFRAKLKKYNGKAYGYFRIFSFNHSDASRFLQEFQRIVEQFDDTEGLILDVRGNGGGNIIACEYALQALSKKKIEPHSTQFIDGPITRELAARHSPSAFEGLDLSPWRDSFIKLTQVGEAYSLPYPITSKKKLHKISASFKGQMLLITDALCYSATDIFAAGFKDNNLGPILGINANTGAGGANVWTHSLLKFLTDDENGENQYFKDLPSGVEFRVSIRRLLRQGKNKGVPIENLGVKPDFMHLMTKDDLLFNNVDLIEHACELLESKWPF